MMGSYGQFYNILVYRSCGLLAVSIIRQASCGCRVCYNILVYRSICSECGLPAVDIREASCGCIVCGRCYGILSDISICSECGLPAMDIRQASYGCSVCERCYNSRWYGQESDLKEVPWTPENSVTVSDGNIYSESLIVADKKMVHFKQDHEELVVGIETLSSPNPRKDKSSGG